MRQALYQAVDIAAIRRNVMRGAPAKTTGTMIAPMVNGWTKGAGRARDSSTSGAAKKLLADVSCRRVFELTLDCPTTAT